MTLALVLLAILPGLALAGPVLIGIAFDADWILRVGLGFDAVGVVLGVAANWIVRSFATGAKPMPPMGESLATALGLGLIGFGLLFGGITLWYLHHDADA